MDIQETVQAAITSVGSRPHSIKKLTQEELAERRARKDAEAIEDDRRARDARRAEYLKARLGQRFRARTFDTYDETVEPQNLDKVRICKRFANRDDYSDGNGLLIMGKQNGVGKTHMAAAICNALIDRGIPCLYDTYVGHLARLQAEFGSDDRVWLDMMKNVKVLVLDDVGKEKATDWTRSVLFDVINYRYEADKPVIITTNYTDDELEDYLGAATYSRICEMCPTVELKGQDYRLR